jgi:hypothetical protein
MLENKLILDTSKDGLISFTKKNSLEVYLFFQTFNI